MTTACTKQPPGSVLAISRPRRFRELRKRNRTRSAVELASDTGWLALAASCLVCGAQRKALGCEVRRARRPATHALLVPAATQTSSPGPTQRAPPLRHPPCRFASGEGRHGRPASDCRHMGAVTPAGAGSAGWSQEHGIRGGGRSGVHRPRCHGGCRGEPRRLRRRCRRWPALFGFPPQRRGWAHGSRRAPARNGWTAFASSVAPEGVGRSDGSSCLKPDEVGPTCQADRVVCVRWSMHPRPASSV